MRIIQICLTVVLGALACAAIAAQGDSRVLTYGNGQGGRVLVIGCVTNNPKYNYGRMQGIAEYVLEHMRDLGVDAIEVFTVDEPAKMIRLLRDGRVDWVSATPYNAVRYLDESAAELLLAKEQHGLAWYRTIFVTRKDSGIRSLDDLRGRTIAFEKRGSTTAYVIPVTMLQAAGLPLAEMRSVNDAPPADSVGYLFSGDESNSVLWVHKRIVAAAAFSDADWESSWILPDALRPDLTIIAQSDRIPRSLEIVGSHLPDAIKLRLKRTLLAAPADPDARAAIDQYYRATGFGEIDDEVRAALDRVRDGAARLKQVAAP